MRFTVLPVVLAIWLSGCASLPDQDSFVWAGSEVEPEPKAKALADARCRSVATREAFPIFFGRADFFIGCMAEQGWAPEQAN